MHDEATIDRPRLVFLISQPRSGSTLLQKMLAVGPEVGTVAEPWLLLPLAGMLEPNAMVAEYWQATCHLALEDLIAQLPGGREEFLQRLRTFVEGVYQSVGGPDTRVFIDKTPRYYLIVSFLADVFPEARFIFLFRNPLEVFSSIISTWCHNRIGSGLKGNYVDIVRGPKLLAEGAAGVGARGMSVDYARLVTEPEATLREVCAFVGIDFMPKMVTGYREVDLEGRMGDPTGVKQYGGVSTDSLAKWKRNLSNAYRKCYARRYVRFLGDDVLAAFGTSQAELLAEIDAIPTTYHGALRDMAGHAGLTLLRAVNHLSSGVTRHRNRRERPYLPYG